jgi:hypothetical protein
MKTPLADLFAAQIADLKKRSDETDRSIKDHISRAKWLIASLKAIDAEFPER